MSQKYVRNVTLQLIYLQLQMTPATHTEQQHRQIPKIS